jgi:hypothetical protein
VSESLSHFSRLHNTVYEDIVGTWRQGGVKELHNTVYEEYVVTWGHVGVEETLLILNNCVPESIQ